MDARSIAATTANGGILTPATEVDYDPTVPEYHYDPSSYEARVYQGFGHGDYDALLKLGPHIKAWPEIAPLGDKLRLKEMCIRDSPSRGGLGIPLRFRAQALRYFLHCYRQILPCGRCWFWSRRR